MWYTMLYTKQSHKDLCIFQYTCSTSLFLLQRKNPYSTPTISDLERQRPKEATDYEEASRRLSQGFKILSTMQRTSPEYHQKTHIYKIISSFCAGYARKRPKTNRFWLSSPLLPIFFPFLFFFHWLPSWYVMLGLTGNAGSRWYRPVQPVYTGKFTGKESHLYTIVPDSL